MSESLSTLRDLMTRTEFHTGIVVGAIALSMLAALALVKAPGSARPWALAFAVATLVGVQFVDDRRLGLGGGVVLMAVGGALVGRSAAPRPNDERWGAFRLIGWLIIATGALLIPWHGQVEEHDWYFVAAPIVAITIGWAFSTWARSIQLRGLGALFAITAFAVWTTVPDTELARLLLGTSLPLALATIPPISAGVTSAGSYALAGVVASIPALGGESRPASIIGSWACIGMIAVVPLAGVMWPDHRGLDARMIFFVHTILVLIAARVIGLWTSAVPAAIAAVCLGAAALALVHRLDGRSVASGRRATRR